MRALLLGVLLTIGCVEPSDKRPVRSVADPKSQPTPGDPLLRAFTPARFPGNWGTGFLVEYETALEMADVEALRREAHVLWAELRPRADSARACTVHLKASEPIRSVALPGTQLEAFSRRNFTFVVRRDSSGRWQWLTSAAEPREPCPRFD
jgi:hypothetical protein